MSAMRTGRLLCLLATLVVGATPALVLAQDQIFPATGATEDIDGAQFENAFYQSNSDADASRFLNMATFGSRAVDIAAVRQQTPAGWLDAQLAQATVTQSRPFLEAFAAQLPTGSSISQDDRLHRWFDVAVTAPDQVRQRVAWALSQIVITSDRDDFLSQEPIMMAEWNDIIVRNALGNYRTLMQEVTYSPMMGHYLTTLRNRKFELASAPNCGGAAFCARNNGVQPDENYAREVMQLFSIGLLVRGDDFYSTFPDPNNASGLLNTYGEDDISNLARVFTGLSYQCTQGASTVGGVVINANCGAGNTACTGIGCRYSNAQGLFQRSPPIDPDTDDRGLLHPDWYRPMVCYPRFNDNGRTLEGAPLPDPLSNPDLPPGSPAPDKVLALNVEASQVTLTIPPSFGPNSAPLNCNSTTITAPEQQQCIDYCEGNINQALDTLYNHPNMPVMAARQLIQRLVTSNPTPEYVQRVAAAFANNGAGVRGDMKAVVRAILLDGEARRPPTAANQPVNFGKVREPMLKLVANWRHFGAVSGDLGVFPATNPQGGASNPLAGQPSRRRWGPTQPQDTYQQRPYGAPSVFNFYEPDYSQPGQVANANLFSPELQIIHEVTSVSAANDLYSRLCSGYGGNNCSAGNTGTLPNDRAYFPMAQIDLIPSRMAATAGVPVPGFTPTVDEDAALIEFFNTRMMGGTMSGTIPSQAQFSCPSTTGTLMKGLLMEVLRCFGGIDEITGGTQVERQRRKALYLMHLIAISPEYSTQR